ncbi:MAG: IclR family transcriptional regulator, partial [Rhodobacterales bacterium]|nr:IclR family transcriptional regulator [Rhodobacterales bacterium]
RRQILLNIANKVKETVNFVVPEASGMNYIDRVETDWAFRIQLPIGTNVPFHCTASGKCFLASLSPKKRKMMIASMDLKAYTKSTHVREDTLLSELKQIAKQGYALDQEEFMDGMVAIAVPITDYHGRFAAAIAFHGPTQRISIENALARKDILTQAAEELAKSLFSEN